MPKITAKVLTDRTISTATGTDKRQEIPDGGCTGLYLIIQPSSAKSWAVRYVYRAKIKKLTIGTYPAISLADARVEARKVLGLAGEGRDPQAEKVEAKIDAPPPLGETVNAVLDEFVKRHLSKNSEKYALETGQAFDREVRPAWGKKLIADIRRKDIIRMLDDMIDRGKPTAANRLHSHLRKLFNWCLEREIIDVSPLGNLKAPVKEETRERVLNDREMRLVWLSAEKLGYPFGPFVQGLMLTAQRRDEIAGCSWSEFDFNNAQPALLLPRTRTKNRRDHLIPLAPSAVALFKGQPKITGGKGEDFMFTTTGETSVSGYGRAKANLDAGMLALAKQEAAERGEDPEKVTLEDWTFHDIRRTVATRMAELKIPPHVVEAVLNHKSGTIKGVAAVYNRHEYREEKRDALEKWAIVLKRIIATKPGSNVVPLRKGD